MNEADISRLDEEHVVTIRIPSGIDKDAIPHHNIHITVSTAKMGANKRLEIHTRPITTKKAQMKDTYASACSTVP